MERIVVVAVKAEYDIGCSLSGVDSLIVMEGKKSYITVYHHYDHYNYHHHHLTFDILIT